MRKKKPKKDNSERWLLTYSDLITLLMIFFVIMYAMSNVDAAKYAQLSNSLRGVFSGSKYVLGQGGNGQEEDKEGNNNVDEKVYNEAQKSVSRTQELEKNLGEYLKKNNLQSKVDVQVEQRGLIVSLKDSIFFESGRAEVSTEYAPHLLKIGQILDSLNCDIVIEGYTDNVPIHTSAYPSNWELAAMRAVNVVHLLSEKGNLNPAKLSAVSYGEYRPIASNDTKEGKAKNRRINIVVLNSEFYKESISKR